MGLSGESRNPDQEAVWYFRSCGGRSRWTPACAGVTMVRRLAAFLADSESEGETGIQGVIALEVPLKGMRLNR